MWHIVVVRCQPSPLPCWSMASWNADPLRSLEAYRRLPAGTSTPHMTHSGSSSPALRGERSEEHTSELQSLRHLVCRLLLEKKKTSTTDSSVSAPRSGSSPPSPPRPRH